MKIVFLLLYLVPVFIYSQKKNNYKNILPKDVDARPLLDSVDNYLPDSLNQAVFNYIKSKDIDPKTVFIDKLIYYDKDGTIHIRIWDVEYFKNKKQYDYDLRHHRDPASYTRGFTGEIKIDAKTKQFLHFYFDM
jgi:hypothetical protein